MIGESSEYSKSQLIGINSPDILKEGSYFANICENEEIVASLYVNKYQESYLIRDVFVLESQRRKGYGRKLLEEILGFLRPKNIPIYIHVRPTNKIALSLYEKIGFKIDNNLKSPFGYVLVL
jgi:GNAT superfamily N-acetyltransferase